MSSRSALLLLSLTLFACKHGDEEPQTTEAAITKYGPAVEAKLAVATKIGANLPLSVAEADGYRAPYGDPKLAYLREDMKDKNATMAMTDDLHELTEVGDVSMRPRWTELLNHCAAIIRKHVLAANTVNARSIDINGGMAAYWLHACSNLQYLFVLSTKEAAAATADEQHHTFTPGLWRGVVLAYDLTDGSLLGSFKFATDKASDKEVAASGSQLTERFTNDLNTGLEKAIHEHAHVK